MILQKTELRKLQLIEIEMLKEFIKICDALNLRYYILGGTMLGAVRHKGFIPWDDDIDIGMPRTDYEIFWKKAQELLPEPLFLQHYLTDKDYCANIIKIMNKNTTFIECGNWNHNICHGVFIDVFPLDNYPVTAAGKLWYKVRRKILAARIGRVFVHEDRNPVKELVKTSLDWIWPDVKKAVEAKDRLFSSFPYSGMIANYCGMWGEKEVVPAEWYAEGCELLFEGITVRAPKEYKKWLTQVYGDYMKLPPEEKRVSHHETTIIDLERPYTEYME